MRNLKFLGLLLFTAAAVTVVARGEAQTSANGAEPAGSLEKIVVTAQKRSESINSVPMSINALSRDEMRN